MAGESKILVVEFLVPAYDRKGKPYRRSVHKQIRWDLEDHFDGWSLAADKPLAGVWRNPESGDVEYDDSWRYEAGIVPLRLGELEAYLAELSHGRGQKALWGSSTRAAKARSSHTRSDEAVSIAKVLGNHERSTWYLLCRRKMHMALGDSWLPQPITGRGTPTGFAQHVIAAGRLFERAHWKQAHPGVVEQYREVRLQNSGHLLVHADRTWRIDHIDDDNPDQGRVIEHALNDPLLGKVINATAIGGAVVGGVYLLGRSIAALFGGTRRRPSRRRRA